MKKTHLLFISKILMSILILSVLIYKLDYGLLADNLRLFPLVAILLMVIHYLVTIFMNSLSLFILLNSNQRQIPFSEFLKLNWFSLSLGQFSPARFGELSIVYMLKKKYHFPVGISSASFLIHKISVMVTLVLFSFVMFFVYFQFLSYLYILLGLFLIAMVIFIFMMPKHKIRLFVRKYIFRKYAAVVADFHAEMRSLIKKRWLPFVVILTHAFKLTLTASLVTIILMIQGVEVSLLLVTGINAVSLLASFVPISFSGIGIKESVVVFLFHSLSYNATIIATTYIMLTAVYLLFNFFVFLYFVYIRGRVLKTI